MDLETNKESLDQRVNTAAKRVNRDPGEICLLAVSKRQTAETVRSLAVLGQQSFGENYLQEALEKINQLADLALEWHFIGQIQRNKTAAIAENFDWAQSIDRLLIAERLSAQRPAKMDKLNVCIQVRMSEEYGKGGVSIDELLSLANAVSSLSGLVLRGLMTIPENTRDTEKQRQSFRRMYGLFNKMRSQHASVDTLSMGMSGNFEAAVEEGSTMIRVGTALFGSRN
ncbi:MAG: YggS family pyridoxal phosphate-dependent enzyme [Gammaproteobacteria bacterium]|nr:YggS family pyridoxal phosphate-dependent enzyme [Gammaproteobacteria bacterium]